MPKIFNRIVAVLLIPSVLVDPSWAVTLSQPPSMAGRFSCSNRSAAARIATETLDMRAGFFRFSDLNRRPTFTDYQSIIPGIAALAFLSNSSGSANSWKRLLDKALAAWKSLPPPLHDIDLLVAIGFAIFGLVYVTRVVRRFSSKTEAVKIESKDYDPRSHPFEQIRILEADSPQEHMVRQALEQLTFIPFEQAAFISYIRVVSKSVSGGSRREPDGGILLSLHGAEIQTLKERIVRRVAEAVFDQTKKMETYWTEHIHYTTMQKFFYTNLLPNTRLYLGVLGGALAGTALALMPAVRQHSNLLFAFALVFSFYEQRITYAIKARTLYPFLLRHGAPFVNSRAIESAKSDFVESYVLAALDRAEFERRSSNNPAFASKLRVALWVLSSQAVYIEENTEIEEIMDDEVAADSVPGETSWRHAGRIAAHVTVDGLLALMAGLTAYALAYRWGHLYSVLGVYLVIVTGLYLLYRRIRKPHAIDQPELLQHFPRGPHEGHPYLSLPIDAETKEEEARVRSRLARISHAVPVILARTASAARIIHGKGLLGEIYDLPNTIMHISRTSLGDDVALIGEILHETGHAIYFSQTWARALWKRQVRYPWTLRALRDLPRLTALILTGMTLGLLWVPLHRWVSSGLLQDMIELIGAALFLAAFHRIDRRLRETAYAYIRPLREAFVSAQAMKNRDQDMAETFKQYLLNPNHFLHRILENPLMAAHYVTMEMIINLYPFETSPILTTEVTVPAASPRPADRRWMNWLRRPASPTNPLPAATAAGVPAKAPRWGRLRDQALPLLLLALLPFLPSHRPVDPRLHAAA